MSGTTIGTRVRERDDCDRCQGPTTGTGAWGPVSGVRDRRATKTATWAPGDRPSMSGTDFGTDVRDLAQLIPYELTHVRASPRDCADGLAQAARKI
eukprot:scaffold67256_cov77-Phaeocystis_antarctica.AAC.1